MTTLPLHRDAPVPPEDFSTVPLLSLGFRPFFFLATLSAMLLVPTFLARLGTAAMVGPFDAIGGHAHEMLFGFTTAVVAGFLLTAAGNWTGERTATGLPLGLLAGLWALGRVALVLPGIPSGLASAVDLAFLPTLLLVVARPVLRTKNRRNYVFLFVVAGLFGADLVLHLEAHGILSRGIPAKELALRLLAFLLCLVYGRILPMFTRNATGDARIRAVPLVDRFALGSLLVAIAGDLLRLPGELAFAFWSIAGILAIARMSTWGTWRARSSLLWVLHAGYGLTALSFLLEAAARVGWVPTSTAIHLFTVGGIGLSCLGMMTRVSLGHSGRMLVANRRMTVAFVLLILAAPVRAFGPLVDPAHVRTWLSVSGTLWSVAFALLLSFGWSIWTSPRLATKVPYHR